MRRAWALALLIAGCPDTEQTTGTTETPPATTTTTAAATTAAAGSSSGEAGMPVSLIDQTAWVDTPEASDPLADHRPPMLDCGIAAWFLEAGDTVLEMDTGVCDYMSLEQPMLVGVEEGQTLGLEMFHFDLTAPEPAEAHIALLLGETVVWERVIPIPGGPGGSAPAEVWQETFSSEVSAPAGTPLRLHLHNHGQNTWNLTEIWAEVH